MVVHYIMFLVGWLAIGVGVFIVVTNLKELIDR